MNKNEKISTTKKKPSKHLIFHSHHYCLQSVKEKKSYLLVVYIVLQSNMKTLKKKETNEISIN